jgi:hypothetical protein
VIYLLDANVLIDANRDYYPIARIPEFWEWLVYMGNKGKVKIPTEIHDEIKDGRDDLAVWARDSGTTKALLLNEELTMKQVSKVITKGYAPDLNEDEIGQIGRDAFLIAYALSSPANRCVVTTEVSKPKRMRANRHVPDVCKTFEISCCHTHEFTRTLSFGTNWKSGT